MTPTSDPARRYAIVFNARSGSVTPDMTAGGLVDRFHECGLAVAGGFNPSTSLATQLQEAAASDANVVVAAGGDGTATAVASAVVGTDKALALLPLGTANLLARDLGIPLDIDDAIARLKTMSVRRIDVGDINRTLFLHKIVIGFVPGVAAARERLRGDTSIGAFVTFLKRVIRRVLQARHLKVELTKNHDREEVHAAAIAVANNAYDEGVGRFFTRSSLDGGTLSVYILRRSSITAMLKLAAGMLIGRWKRSEELSISTACDVVIQSRRRRLVTMIDGEVATFDTPLHIQIKPKALKVLAPAPGAGPVETLGESQSR
jgi:YegS/Rv2252/BmrU family lipid kinase